MKKWIACVLALLVTACSCAAIGDSWIDVTPDELMQRAGLRLECPAQAEVLSLQLLESEPMEEMQFAWCGAEYTARVCPAFGFEDISGMHYEWTSIESGEVRGREAQILRADDGENRVALCLWADIAPGLMYSLATVTDAQTDVDIRAVAEMLFVPVQGDAGGEEAVSALEYAGILMQCTGYEGTVGASLKEAIAACALYDFAVRSSIADADPAVAAQELSVAFAAFPRAQRDEIASGLQGIIALIDAATDDPEIYAGLFDDAGMAEAAVFLRDDDDSFRHWKAFVALLRTVIGENN